MSLVLNLFLVFVICVLSYIVRRLKRMLRSANAEMQFLYCELDRSLKSARQLRAQSNSQLSKAEDEL